MMVRFFSCSYIDGLLTAFEHQERIKATPEDGNSMETATVRARYNACVGVHFADNSAADPYDPPEFWIPDNCCLEDFVTFVTRDFLCVTS